ncbi:hypothetical protein F5Y17DRAFT_360199 [Xylariaceae sp. FL0594]|nr:hypothetical protein F5Y17DRAFT_360199 [Xylariaceae sp. FL0594]
MLVWKGQGSFGSGRQAGVVLPNFFTAPSRIRIISISPSPATGQRKSMKSGIVRQMFCGQKGGQCAKKKKMTEWTIAHEFDASAVNRTRGPSMATMDFTTKPLMLLGLI